MKKQKILRILDQKSLQLKKIRDFRLYTGLLLGLCVFLIPIIKSSYLTGVVALYWFFVFPYLVALSRKLDTSIQKLQQYYNFIHRQDEKKQGILRSSFYVSNTVKNELNITGLNSLYDFINESWSREGAKQLEKELSDSPLSLSSILDRQAWIQNLSSLYFQFVKLKIQMNVLNPNGFDVQKAFESIHEIKKPQRLEQWTVGIWCVACLMAFLPYAIFLPVEFSRWAFMVWVLFWVLQAFSFQMRGSQFFKSLEIELAVTSLIPIFNFFGKMNKNETLPKIAPSLMQENPAQYFSKIKFFISLMSVETHILVALVLNLLSPYHILVSWGLARYTWFFTEKESVFKKEIQSLDVISSLVFLKVEHTSVFPTWSEDTDPIPFSAQNIYLPLISRQKVIKNNFEIKLPHKIVLITGSNMSGKSTFLRTLAQNQALALIGAPVFADQFRTVHAKIESCINITDSVMLSYSYFLSEVKRLKEIYDSSKKQKVIFFLDELFRGTNQKERVIAAKSFLKDLAEFQSLGFITTHDKEITELSESSAAFKACYFSENFETNDISFTYKIQNGIAQTTNALRILKREGLPVYEDI